jgi:cell division protein FtsI (penicillin-binding protein 3)
MDPKTGEILALANWPDFDLNSTPKISPHIRRNRAISDIFEPGSVFKIVTASCALEEKKFGEDDLIFCENGKYRISNHILHDYKPHGWLKFREVIEQSSNIGVTKIAQRLGKDAIFKYIRLFGFGNTQGIDLPGEINGINKEPKYWSKTSIGAIPIGQEIGVTALQLASAISAIANNGILMKPYIVKRIQDKKGEIIKEFTPQILTRVISPETSLRMKEILNGVVERGTGRLAKIKGYSVCGKTGTAQKLESDGNIHIKNFLPHL